jgi:hypothetical protein
VQKSSQVELNIWVFVDVFQATLWSGISATMMGLAVAFFAVRYISGEWIHYPVKIKQHNSQV